MDIATQSEVTLRQAGFETWQWTKAEVPAVCFENEAVVGFVFVFPTGRSLLDGWQRVQHSALSHYASALRRAGGKAWNVYSVLLTGATDPMLVREIERLEEDFSMTRKIARSGITTTADLVNALLPLIPLQSAPVLGEGDFRDRLRNRLTEIPEAVVDAFLGESASTEVARLLTGAK